MRVARKRVVGLPKKRRRSTPHPLVLASYNVREDGTHVLTVPVYTFNPNNGPNGETAFAAKQKSRNRKVQRAMVGIHLSLNEVPRYFRGVRLVRLAPSNPGLDTGGLWAALKSPQDEVAKHLGIGDGPNSPASWELAQEFSRAYGVRIELQLHRAPDYRVLYEQLQADMKQLLVAARAAKQTLRELAAVGDAFEFDGLSELEAIDRVAAISAGSNALDLLRSAMPSDDVGGS